MNSYLLAPLQSLEVMKRSPYFRGWDEKRLAKLAQDSKMGVYAKGERLIQKGETLHALQIVIQGQVRVALPLPNGSERLIVLVNRGESFGEACLVEQAPTPYHVIASTNSRLLSIDGAALLKEMRHDVTLCNRMLGVVAKRMLGLLSDTEVCAQRSGAQRVACFLMRQRPENAGQSFLIELPASKRDIAAKVGLAPETFSRVLASLHKQGAIRVDGRKIRVENSRLLMGLLPENGANEPIAA